MLSNGRRSSRQTCKLRYQASTVSANVSATRHDHGMSTLEARALVVPINTGAFFPVREGPYTRPRLSGSPNRSIRPCSSLRTDLCAFLLLLSFLTPIPPPSMTQATSIRSAAAGTGRILRPRKLLKLKHTSGTVIKRSNNLHFASLPDDVLILVFIHVDIDDILALRLVRRVAQC